ncbi:MAG: hypothetical protein ACI9VM_000649 [Candidatus Azotimanducaceae bacterium]|jgi:hypothetical protein
MENSHESGLALPTIPEVFAEVIPPGEERWNNATWKAIDTIIAEDGKKLVSDPKVIEWVFVGLEDQHLDIQDLAASVAEVCETDNLTPDQVTDLEKIINQGWRELPVLFHLAAGIIKRSHDQKSERGAIELLSAALLSDDKDLRSAAETFNEKHQLISTIS